MAAWAITRKSIPQSYGIFNDRDSKGIAKQRRLFLIEIIIGSRARRIPWIGFNKPRDSILAPILRKLQLYLDGQKVDFSENSD